MKDYPYFSAKELRCKCKYCDGGQMDESFMKKLIATRVACNFPFKINSAFRCKGHNEHVGGSKFSAHLFGRAVDIKCSGSEAIIIIEMGLQSGLTGFGVKQKLGEPIDRRMLHVDDFSNKEKTNARRPAIWSY